MNQLWTTCYQCGDFLIWVFNDWFCPTCEKETIERLKYRLFLIASEQYESDFSFEKFVNRTEK